MPQRRFAALVLATVATLAACGSSGDSDTSSASATADGDVVAVDGDMVAVDGDVVAVGDGVLLGGLVPGRYAMPRDRVGLVAVGAPQRGVVVVIPP